MNGLKLLAFALFSVAVLSCNDAFENNQTMPDLRTKDPVVYTGNYIDVALDVELPKVAMNVDKGKNSTRIFSFIKDGDLIRVNYDQMLDRSLKVYFALRKNGMQDNQVTYFDLDAKITKTSDGKYKLTAQNKSIQLNNGGLSSDYFIQAMTLGPGTTMVQDPADKSYSFDMTPQNGFFESDVENMPSAFFKIPLATKWTPINFQANASGGSININNLQFTPQGVLLRFEGVNNLAKKVELRTIEMETLGFASLGSFKLGKSASPTIDTSLPVKFEFQKSDDAYKKGGLNGYNWSETKIDLVNKQGAYNTIESGAKTNFYIYVMPNDIGDQDYRFSFKFKYKVDGSGERDVYPSPKVWKYFERSSIPQSNGKVITVRDAGLPESDLMITEFFHNNPGGNNYSMIEIYNPTSKPIDLRKYGLIKIRTVLDDNLAGIHPSDYEKLDNEPILETQAWVQDLWIDPNKPGYLQNNDQKEIEMMTVRQADGNLTKSSKVERLGPALKVSDYANLNRYHYMSYPGTDKGYMLEPGQTIILGATGFYDQVYKYANPVGSGETQNATWMPDGASSTGMRGIKENVYQGKCKYVILVDNSYKNVSGMAGGYQYSPGAGVLHHGNKHVMALVKWGRKNAASGYDDKIIPIDEAGPAFDYMVKYEQKDWETSDSKQYLKKLYDQYKQNLEQIISSSTFKSGNDDFGFIRNEYVMYPSIEFKYNLLDDNDPDNQWTKCVGDGPDAKNAHSFGKRH